MSIQGGISKVIGSVGMAAKLSHDRFYRKTPQERSPARREQANKRAEDLMRNKEAQRQKRRNFMRDYLSKQTTSFGGTVGDLPKNVQKQIASQYTPAERKRLMDAMDMSATEEKKHG